LARGFLTLLAAQFFSGLADNALLLLAIALLVEQAREPWWVPVLKGLSIFSFVILAPWVGVLSDRWPKRNVMMAANAIKVLACIGLLVELHPFFAFALLGFGAAIYSPAKYGLITELEPAERLVKANAWLEVSTVLAAVLGVVLGGWLIGRCALEDAPALKFLAVTMAPTPLLPAFMALLGLYATAALLNLGIPQSGAVNRPISASMPQLVQRFIRSNLTLWQDQAGQLSLSVTTLFWGVGAAMQLMVLAWAQSQLGLSLEAAAYLQGCVAAGVILGAFLAARLLQLHHARSILWVGWVLGALLPFMNWIESPALAMALMVLIGTMTGFFVVPMNALLQNRGHALLSSGESIAVQNFNENCSGLSMLAVYSTLLALQIPIHVLLPLLGASIVLCMTLIMLNHYKLQRRSLLQSFPQK
jgi:MFS family permease